MNESESDILEYHMHVKKINICACYAESQYKYKNKTLLTPQNWQTIDAERVGN